MKRRRELKRRMTGGESLWGKNNKKILKINDFVSKTCAIEINFKLATEKLALEGLEKKNILKRSINRSFSLFS